MPIRRLDSTSPAPAHRRTTQDRIAVMVAEVAEVAEVAGAVAAGGSCSD